MIVSKPINISLGLILLFFSVLRSQPITLYGEVQNYTDHRSGIDFSIEPRMSATWGGALFDAANIVCKLESLGPRNNDNPTPIRINYKGKIYDFFSFNRELVPFFEKLIIRSVHITLETNNLIDCPEIIGTDIQLGGTFSGFCTPKTTKNNVSLTIKSIKISRVDGISELQKKIDELEAEKKKQEQNKAKVEQLKTEADNLYNEKKYASAIEKFEEILEIEPSNHYAKLRKESAERELRSSGKTTQQNKTNNTSTNSSSSSGQAELRRRQAMALEQEGDEYYKLNNLVLALEKYKQAQSLYYTTAVENKIKEIDHYYNLAKGLNELGKNIDVAIEKADPKQRTNFSHVAIRYEQGIRQPEYKGNMDFYGARSLTGDFVFHRLGMSFGTRMGYKESQSIYRTTGAGIGNSSIIFDETASARLRGFNMGLFGGLNIPINVNKLHLQLYGNYGFDMILGRFKLDARNFILNEKGNDMMFFTALSFGINWQIPNSTVGIGLCYSFLNVRDEGTSHELNYIGYEEEYPYSLGFDKGFYLWSPIQEINKYSSVSLSILLSLPER